MAKKVIQKTYQKIDLKIIEKLPQNGSKMEPIHGRRSDHFWALFLDWFLQGTKGLPGTQNERFWLPKWTPKASKMVTKTPSRHRKCNTSDRCLKAEFKFCRVIPKKIYDKKVPRWCPAQRAQLTKNVPITIQKFD